MSASKFQQVIMRDTEASQNFSELIQRVFSDHDRVIVERDGLPIVVIISASDYEALLQKIDQYERLKQFQSAARMIGEEVARSGLDEEQIMTQVEEARQQMYDSQHGE